MSEHALSRFRLSSVRVLAVVPPIQLPLVDAAADRGGRDKNAGKELGYVLIAAALLSFIPYLGWVFSITTLVLASVLVCGCCCARDYDLAPRTRGYAKAVLAAWLLSLVSSLVYAGVALAYVAKHVGDLSDAYTDDEIRQALEHWNFWETIGVLGVGPLIVFIFNIVCSVVVVVFAFLFTFHR